MRRCTVPYDSGHYSWRWTDKCKGTIVKYAKDIKLGSLINLKLSVARFWTLKVICWFSIIILKIFPKLFFDFWTWIAILYKWWFFYNYKFFSSYFFIHLKILVWLPFRSSIHQNSPIFNNYFENVPKIIFRFFCIFELGQQFCTSGEFFIIISFFPHIFLSI